MYRYSAEFRGPGVHHNFDDSDSGYDPEDSSGGRFKGFSSGGNRGRIIFLGDGSEVLTNSEDTEMFDSEDKDLDSQVSKTADDENEKTDSGAKSNEKSEGKTESSDPDAKKDESRSEATPKTKKEEA